MTPTNCGVVGYCMLVGYNTRFRVRFPIKTAKPILHGTSTCTIWYEHRRHCWWAAHPQHGAVLHISHALEHMESSYCSSRNALDLLVRRNAKRIKQLHDANVYTSAPCTDFRGNIVRYLEAGTVNSTQAGEITT